MLMVLKTYMDTVNAIVLYSFLLFQADFIVISFLPPLSKYKLTCFLDMMERISYDDLDIYIS